ncbi:MAG: hypothetical protein ACRCZ1_07460 [Cetobacterium sp.]
MQTLRKKYLKLVENFGVLGLSPDDQFSILKTLRSAIELDLEQMQGKIKTYIIADSNFNGYNSSYSVSIQDLKITSETKEFYKVTSGKNEFKINKNRIRYVIYK